MIRLQVVTQTGHFPGGICGPKPLKSVCQNQPVGQVLPHITCVKQSAAYVYRLAALILKKNWSQNGIATKSIFHIV